MYPPSRKAIWNVKHVLAVGFAAMLALQAVPASAERRGGGPSPNHHGPSSRSGLPNSFAKDYRVDHQLVERRARNLDPSETVDLIVTFNGQDQQLPVAFRRYVCGPRLDIINGYALCKVPVRRLDQLALVASIHRIHHNRPAKQSDMLSSTAVEAETLAKDYGYNGQGVTVAFIDSGLTSDHPDLKNRNVLRSLDFVGRSNPREDENGHGTHVTGIVAGTGASDPRFAGIAPGVKIVSLKVLDANGQGSIGDIIAAMDWVAKNHTVYNIRIVNMSVGAGVYESYWTDPLTLAAKALVDEGITVVAAAGNFGKNAEGRPQWGGITSPGVAPWVLTACAFSTNGTLDTSDDMVASFSSAGPTAFDFTAKPDVCAPGVGIVSLAAPESQLYHDGLMATPSWLVGTGTKRSAIPYLSLSGTSQAAPFVTGTVAMMLQANPNLTPNLIKAILQYTATPKPGVSPLHQGAGFMNSLGAVTLASFYAHPSPGSMLPVDESWSQEIIWGNYKLSGGVIDPNGNAWMPGVEWGWAKTQGDDGDNIVWGTECRGEDCSLMWLYGDDGDNIVWGTADDGDNIVWGTADDEDNIVWGTDCGGDDCDNVVWGAADDEDNIVWGTADDEDNIVWGTECRGEGCDLMWLYGDDGDNIVWGTECRGEGCDLMWLYGDDGDNIVWGTSNVQNVVWPAYRRKGGR